MDGDEVDEADDVAPIVFVFERLVDEVLYDDLEEDVGDDREQEQQHVFQFVNEDEACDRRRQRQAQKAE
eukprot:CAMPEP_0185575392 /NCGR_PEP_ID=MMETSP0434-20130131/6606_1 /TAXON_ID=626734 ORGANISM="Favella taraikaensis, Strain Fe Narragansett Bay" /NCGR_SAMPLE_ID=MMETSP0434 /ASSEMBLY_ACC=CAM_ASM_000379 /LENGTH=68 /DNA_ID=CAMNT_0028192265 /DNA_START=1525 /DNA_END=1731 /DNA_ORIENTATION=-